MTDLDDRLVAAIHRNAVADEARRVLASADDADAANRAASILATCRRIGAEVSAEADRLRGLLVAAGVDADGAAPPELLQRHELVFMVTRDDARRAVAVLERHGFHRHPRWTRGAERSFWATSSEVSLTRTEASTMVVRLRWRSRAAGGRFTRAFRPRPADWEVLSLPDWAWWAYSAVRPVRLALRRVGFVRRDHGAIEPFLATPTALIEPLLEVAEVDSDDVVADIGCGDGRIVVAAAELTGCRAVGVEYSPELVVAARRSVDRAGLGERVNIIEGDGRTIDVSQITVVLLFLPMNVAVGLVPDLLTRMPAGARLVLHEQSPLDQRLPAPAASMPVIADDALTVAHLWRVGEREHERAGQSRSL